MTLEEMEALKHLTSAENEDLVNKLKVLGMQMEGMDAKEKAQFSELGGLTKSLGKLRRLLRKNMTDEQWQWTIYVSVVLLVLVYG